MGSSFPQVVRGENEKALKPPTSNGFQKLFFSIRHAIFWEGKINWEGLTVDKKFMKGKNAPLRL